MKNILFLMLFLGLASCGVFTPVSTTVSPETTALVAKYTHSGTNTTIAPVSYTLAGTETDTFILIPTGTEFLEYSVSCAENNVTTIRLLTSTGRILGYRTDGNGTHIAFDIEASPSPWSRDNEKVYDTFFGPVRIGIHPTLFLPYQGRISLGTQMVWNVTSWQRR